MWWDYIVIVKKKVSANLLYKKEHLKTQYIGNYSKGNDISKFSVYIYIKTWNQKRKLQSCKSKQCNNNHENNLCIGQDTFGKHIFWALYVVFYTPNKNIAKVYETW